MIKTIEYLTQAAHACITSYAVDRMLEDGYKLKVTLSQQDSQLVVVECKVTEKEYIKFLSIFEENKEQTKEYAQELLRKHIR